MDYRKYAVCGLDCSECHSLGKECRGCAAECGKPYWTVNLAQKICPIYACAAARNLLNCGECDEVPCAIWLSLQDPALSDDAFKKSIRQRLDNLLSLRK